MPARRGKDDRGWLGVHLRDLESYKLSQEHAIDDHKHHSKTFLSFGIMDSDDLDVENIPGILIVRRFHYLAMVVENNEMKRTQRDGKGEHQVEGAERGI